MTSPEHRGAPLLAGLAAGAALVATLVLVTPAGALPAELRPATAVPLAVAPSTSTARPTPRAVVPRPRPIAQAPITPPTTTAPPADPTSPPTTTEETSEPTTTRPAPADEAGSVVAATNAERADAGCDPLDTDRRLTAAAQGHAVDMATGDFFSHTTLDGREFDDRIRAAGHPAPGGENIAQGQDSGAEVVAAWMSSPSHRRNILDCSFVSTGVGFDPRGNQWVQNFGR